MKILIADDCATNRATIQKQLTDCGYEVMTAENGVEALDALIQEDPPRLLLLDWVLPKLDGLTVCRRIRQANRESYIYIIILTAHGDREHLITALDAEADDFLTEPFNIDELKQRVAAGKRIIELQDRLHSTQERLRVEASRDELTGAWNRGAIIDLVTQEVFRSSRMQRPLSLLLVDIDRFKSINDLHGPATGDLILSGVTERLARCSRSYDSLGRYGGDEMLLVLPETTAYDALKVAERLRMTIEERPIKVGVLSVPISVSVGVAAMSEGDKSPQQLVLEADQALYAAKRRGRNLVQLAGVYRHETALPAAPLLVTQGGEFGCGNPASGENRP